MHSRHIKFVLAGVLLTTGVLVLGVITLGDPKVSMIHFTPDQLLRADAAEYEGRGIQVDGYVAEGTERFDPSVPELRFQVRDLAETAYIDVVYRAGLKPDSFIEGQGVVVDGRYDRATGTIEAARLVTKCPSKYEVSPDDMRAMAMPTTDATASSETIPGGSR